MSRAVADLYDAGKAAWPGIDLPRDVFESHLTEVCAEPPPIERAADLYLAYACAHGVAGAAAAFEASYGDQLARAAAKIDRDPAFVAEAAQRARERILVARADQRPRIAEYAGRGSLRGWLVAATTRLALDLRRSDANRRHDPLRSSIGGAAPSVADVAILRARFKAALEEALRSGLASLSTRERALLRLSLVERMSVDAIGVAYRVSRATAARWVVAAREALLEATRGRFCEVAHVTSDEFDSIAKVLHNEVDVSIAARLASDV
jgi:RNA polymerase sigma-70 factor (ECF subfamily)